MAKVNTQSATARRSLVIKLVDDELTHINIQCKIPEITISKEAGTQFLYDVKIVNEVFESFDQK